MIFLFPRWDMLIPWRVWRKHHSSTHEEIHWRFCQVNEGEGTKHGAGELSFKSFSFFFFVWHLGCSFLDLLHRSRVQNSPRWITQNLVVFLHSWQIFFCANKKCKIGGSINIMDDDTAWFDLDGLKSWAWENQYIFFDSYQIISSTPTKMNMEPKNWWFADVFSLPKGHL